MSSEGAMRRAARNIDLHWLIHFSEIQNLATLPPAEWQELKDDLLAFLGWWPHGVLAIQTPNPQGWDPRRVGLLTPQRVAVLQPIAEGCLRGVARGHRRSRLQQSEFEQYADGYRVIHRGGTDQLQVSAWADDATGELAALNFRVAVPEGTLVYDLHTPGECRRRLETNDLETAFRFALGEALSACDTSLIRTCLRCARLFCAIHKKQEFCSQHCKNIHNLSKRRSKERLAKERQKRLTVVTKRKAA
jgi:hypothetical protein